MVIGLAEFLEKVGKLKRTQEKVDALQHNDSHVLRVTLWAIYNPKVKFDLPEGTPPYKVCDIVDQEHVLLREIRKIPYFVPEMSPNLTSAKRQQLFIELLENVAPADAELLIKMKDKQPVKGITLEIVLQAFPEIFSDNG